MTIMLPESSYRTLKAEAGPELARRMLLATHHRLGNCVEATARFFQCAKGTVYQALLKEALGDLTDRTHTPQTRCAHMTTLETEMWVIALRDETGFGRKRLRRLLLAEGIDVPVGTIGHILKRHGRRHPRRHRKYQAPLITHPEQYAPFAILQVDLKEILDQKALPPEVYQHVLRHGLPVYQWTAIDVRTRLRFLAWSFEKTWTNGKAFVTLVVWWLRAFGVHGTILVQTDGGTEFAAETDAVLERSIRDVWAPLGVDRRVITKRHAVENTFVERSHRTDDEELYVPWLTSVTTTQSFLKLGRAWTEYYNCRRPHQGLDDRTPLEALQTTGVWSPEISSFLPFLLDGISADALFFDPVRTVQEQVVHYL